MPVFLFLFLFISCGSIDNSVFDDMVVSSVLDTNVENSAVRRYYEEISEEQYPNGDYNSSFILDFFQDTLDFRYDCPAPILFSWHPSSKELELQISRAMEPNDQKFSYILREGDDSLLLYNLMPATTYYYKVIDRKQGNDITCSSGFFKTKGVVRMLKIDGIYNVRDNGGWKSFIGNQVFSIKYGLLFRGGRLNNEGVILSKEGQTVFRQERIGTEIDFRYDAEAKSITESPIGPDVVYSRDYQTSGAYDYGGVTKKDDFVRAAKLAIKSIVEWEKPVYYHCAVGADRTGTFAFLLEGLLGVRELDLAKDYELTSLCPELRPRQRTNPEYIQLVKAIASINGNNTLEQEDFYLYFSRGVPGKKGDYKNPDGSPSEFIDGTTLKRFICYMTGCAMEDLFFL